MIRVAVITDVHAYSQAELEEKESRPSFAEISNPANPTVNPFFALEELIARDGLKADVLVSGGDLGDKGSPQALTYAWEQIRRVQTLLEAPILLPATGNHDMDSRALNGYDARGALQGLQDYPFANTTLNDAYWANNVVVQNHTGFRSAILNSAAYHGYQEEWRHGRISARTRQYLGNELNRTIDPGVNLFVAHHHLYQHGSIDLDDDSAMKEASALIKMLDSGSYGNWLVIHGHRHWPSVTKASGSQGAPTVFSAGSFSAVLYDEIQGQYRNQFYILEIEDGTPGHRVQGTFRSWDWIADEGFLPAQSRSGLPHVGGFGGHLNGTELADLLAEAYDRDGRPYMPYEEMVLSVPALKFAMPDDLERCFSVAEGTHKLAVLDIKGIPSQIGRMS